MDGHYYHCYYYYFLLLLLHYVLLYTLYYSAVHARMMIIKVVGDHTVVQHFHYGATYCTVALAVM